MSIDEDVENNREEQSSNNDGYSKFIKDVNKSTIEFHSKEEIKKKDFQQSRNYAYEYRNMVDNILQLRIEFFISRERLALIEKIVDLKYHNSFRDFLEEAIINLVELDLNSPESIAQDFCKTLLKNWDMNPESTTTKRKSLQYPVNE